MPLYSDSNYYYSGGSSQLYSPYYTPSLYSTPTSSSAAGYNPYSSAYNRTYSGSYGVPLVPPRTPSYSNSSAHGFASRYQPKLSTITETASPLMGSARHHGHASHGLMPLTRIQSPKISSYTAASTNAALATSKYIPPRPIAINTADIDVSSAHHRQRKEEQEEQAARKRQLVKEAKEATSTPSPSASTKKRGSADRKRDEAAGGDCGKDGATAEGAENRTARSTIKRNRAVVRLSTIRSRSKDRASKSASAEAGSSSSPEPSIKRFHDLPQASDETLSWRQKLADDLAAIPTYPARKSPGDLIRERYLIQEAKRDEIDRPPNRRAARVPCEPPQTVEEVIVALDPLHQTIRRLSIPQCPTFHDICEDISSDKIDDDLNAGALRRRASLIQEQEQELLNKLQKSASGTFQMIHLERRDSNDSVGNTDDSAGRRPSGSVRKSKKGKKIRHKITAIVDIDSPAPLMPTLQEREEDLTTPKFTCNVESVEEHHEMHKIFKLPKKKSVKKVAKSKSEELPDGFVPAIPKAKASPTAKVANKENVRPTAPEIFTFNHASDEKSKDEKLEDEPPHVEKLSTPDSSTGGQVKVTAEAKSDSIMALTSVSSTPKGPNEMVEESKALSKTSTLTPVLKSSMSFDAKALTSKSSKLPAVWEKTQSLNAEEFTVATQRNPDEVEAGNKTDFDSKTSTSILKSSVSMDCETLTTKSSKLPSVLEKTQSLNTDDFTAPMSPQKPKVSTPSSKSFLEVKKPLQKMERKEFMKPLGVAMNTAVTLPGPLSFKAALSVNNQAPTVPKVAPAPTKVLKTGLSLDSETKSIGKSDTKTLEKSKSLNEEPQPPQPPQPPQAQVATPKPIRKAIQKSESGEDFWSQIGSRETLYMTNRKRALIENQWQKSEALLKSQSADEVKKLEEIKTVVAVQKDEALKKADCDIKDSDKYLAGRSNSNESVLCKKTAKQATAGEEIANTLGPVAAKAAKHASPKKTVVAKKPVEAKSGLSRPKTDCDKAETMPASGAAMTAKTTETTTTNATPKINGGQDAKSPERQANECATPTACGDNKTPINKMITLTKTAAELASTATATTTTTKATATTATIATPATKEPKTAIATKAVAMAIPVPVAPQPEVKATDQLTEIKKKSNVALRSSPKSTTTPTPPTVSATDNASDKAKMPTSKPVKTVNKATKVSPVPLVGKGKRSPIAANVGAAINADRFIAMAPAKTATTSPTKAKSASPTAAKAKPPAALAASAATAATTGEATRPQPQVARAATAEAEVTATAAHSVAGNSETRGGSGCGSGGGKNLSKFATVSNLAQCLQDVDADLEDYIPSSAENSDDDDFTDDSSCDYSSANGCANLTASMKKKLKQRRKKEKREEQARFDPQKKVKIDPTNKCYVKEEAPRFPLVATPRPLWKREKIVYPPDEDSDESDSDASGSTEETDESEECTTSEEYEDELRSNSNSASTTPAIAGTGSGNASKENSSIIRMSTCSNDSGFEGGTAPSSPKKMLECDVNCHKKCERLTANLCGVNQKLIVEALAYVKRGARETRDSPSTPPSLNPAYKIEANDEHDETSYTYSQFQKCGRFTAPATVIPRFKNYSVDDFHFLAVLGKGSFGKVLLAELRDTTYYYAVKCLKKDVVLEDDDVDSTLIERKVLALGTKHPYLCHLFCTFQTESHLFFVMEYLNGGDLMFHIQESGRFSEERARFYGAEIISGLKFLHKKGIIYRDLKLDNVLLDYEGHVRIADFGMCKLQIYLDKTADSFCGTPDYMAPEIVKGEKYNQNVDWWSFGVLLYEMLIGQSPFSGCDEDELFWSICNEIPWFPVYISAEATSILKGLLEKDYAKRIGSQYSPAGDIGDHIFFRPIDWGLLEKRQVEPPFKPQVKHPLDTQYFDRVFTRERVRLTPIDKDILQSMDQKQFHGFTYTNPHITLD